ncbi:sugar kinase [Miniphocaeibacter halophilus]|uniref:Sugar kinase n=1 Tax=Miniphocaeibacter halophilus TaxID=2931922 RepID=A0AC61MMS7_9FIRM|nr:sugar kinase [Miniphocaeibacter halophilus]QQK06980.1 sugar kinase [Miniphocaeibacter halophilus]
MKKIVTLGEIMLRLATPNFEKFNQATNYNAVFGGGEANVAVSLANYNNRVQHVTKLPDNELGQAAIDSLNKYRVHTNYIPRGGKRIGIYFLEQGYSYRPSKIIYDRESSSLATATIDDFDFYSIFDRAEWFHISGITPALSKSCEEITLKALQVAKEMGITVSMDVNFRASLWDIETARKVISNLMQYVDVCFDGDWPLGFRETTPDGTSLEDELKLYEKAFKNMSKVYGCKYYFSSLRKLISSSSNFYSACGYNGNEFYHTKVYDVDIIDRVGTGDSFVAGVINCLVKGKNFKEALDFGVAAAVLKHTIPGDVNLVKEEDVYNLLQGGNTRIQR